MWLMPSRRRVANLQRFFAAYKETGGITPGMVLVDMGDYSDNCAEYDALDLPPNWFVQYTDGVTQGEKLAEVWHLVKDCAWLGLIGDDNIPETRGWDQLLVDRLKDAGIVSCNDGWLAPQRLGNCWIMSGPVIKAVGYVFPPGLHHLFVDDVWERLGRATGAWECDMRIMVRHAHVMNGGAPADDTHRATYGDGFSETNPGPDRAQGLWATDEAVFEEWRDGGERERATAAIRALGAEIPNQARVMRVKTRKLMILTPIADNPKRRYTWSMLDTIPTLIRYGIRYAIPEVAGRSNVPKLRNELAAIFLASDYDDAIFIDDDMGWHPEDIIRLLASPEPLVAGVGCRKIDLPDDKFLKWCFRPLPGPVVQDEMGNVEVEAVGTGFVKISREVLETLAAKHPEWKRAGNPDHPQKIRDNYYRFFQFPDDADETGEDYDFCHRWRDVGGKVWIDPTISLIHAGEKEYFGDLTAIFKEAD